MDQSKEAIAELKSSFDAKSVKVVCYGLEGYRRIQNEHKNKLSEDFY